MEDDPGGRHLSQVTPFKADETRELCKGKKAPIVCVKKFTYGRANAVG
jgi:hypothetical protein